MGFSSTGGFSLDNTTVEQNASGEIAIKDGGVGLTQLDPNLINWDLIETLTFSGDSTKTSGTLTAYDEYLIVIEGLVSASQTDVQMRINGDTGANYGTSRLRATTFESGLGENQIYLASCDGTYGCFGRINIKGKTPNVSNGQLNCKINVAGKVAGTTYTGVSGLWKASTAQTQISTLTFLAGANLTGVIKIFGRNF